MRFDGAHDADAHRRRVIRVGIGRAAEGHRPLARPPRPSSGTEIGTGKSLRIRPWQVELEKRQHPRLVGGDDLRDPLLLPAGDGDGDACRLVGEVEGARDDVPVRVHDEAGGWPDTLAHKPGRLPPFFPPPITSSPPVVSILTMLGATFADAAFMAFWVASLTSAAAATGTCTEHDGDRNCDRSRLQWVNVGFIASASV